MRVAKEKVGGKYACATTEIVYLNRMMKKYFITLSGTDVDEKGYLTGHVFLRVTWENLKVPAEQIQYMDVSPRSCWLIASIIPFLQK